MSVEASFHVGSLVSLILFKRVILGLDLQTRRVLLTKCLEYIGEDTPDLRDWFTRCLILSEGDTFGDDMRKSELRSPEYWNTLYAMQNYDTLRSIANQVSRLY